MVVVDGCVVDDGVRATVVGLGAGVVDTVTVPDVCTTEDAGPSALAVAMLALAGSGLADELSLHASKEVMPSGMSRSARLTARQLPRQGCG
jgi:hypothetical protein